MAVPLMLAGYAARATLSRVVLGRLATTTAARALAAGRLSAASRRVPLPFPVFLLPVFDPDYDWYPQGSPLADFSFFQPSQEGGYDVDGWTAYTPATPCGARVNPFHLPRGNVNCSTANAGNTYLSSVLAASYNVYPTRTVISGGYRYYQHYTETYEDPHPTFGSGYAKVTKPSNYYRDWFTANPTWTPPSTYDDLLLPDLAPSTIPAHVAGVIPPVNPAPTLSNVLPQFVPELLPIGNYAKPPVAVPYKDVKRFKNLPWPTSPVFWEPSRAPSKPSGRPSQVPLEDVSEWPQPRVAPNLARSFHDRRPPRRNEKEVKYRLPRAARLAVRAASSFTEALDALNVLYESLPDIYKPRYNDTRFVWKHPPPHIMAKVVWDNFDKIDMAEFRKGFLLNEIQDTILGTAGRGVRRNQEFVDPLRPVGWQAGSAL